MADLRPIRLFAWVLLLLASSASQAQSVRLESPLVQELHVQAGGSYSGSLVLVNPGNATRQARIYQQDYFRREAGQISFTDPGSQPHSRSNLSWVSLPTSLVTLAPGEKRIVDFRVQVPPAGSLTNPTGTYWSSILVEVVEPEQTARSGQVSERGYQIAIRPVFRTGTLVVTQFPSAGSPSVSFVDLRVADPSQSGEKKLLIDFRNDGQRSIRPHRMWVEFYDLGGSKQAEVQLTEASIILPANVYRRFVDLAANGIPPGEYRCLVVVDAGRSELFGTQAQVTVPAVSP